jgi:hypothetical protein
VCLIASNIERSFPVHSARCTCFWTGCHWRMYVVANGVPLLYPQRPYCSVECQKADWSSHKKTCAAP